MKLHNDLLLAFPALAAAACLLFSGCARQEIVTGREPEVAAFTEVVTIPVPREETAAPDLLENLFVPIAEERMWRNGKEVFVALNHYGYVYQEGEGQFCIYDGEHPENYIFGEPSLLSDTDQIAQLGYHLETGEGAREVLVKFYTDPIEYCIGASVFIEETPVETLADMLAYIRGDSGDSALAAYSALLAGNRTVPGDMWIPEFRDGLAYEYTYLDLDGDGGVELLVQMAGDPGGYNGVFHFADGVLVCWNSDAMEMSCRDYPLSDGTMVRQYDINGTRTYTLFRYQADGEREEISRLFAREELLSEDSAEPCPYYEIDGNAVDKAEFEKQLAALVTGRMLPSSAWTGI